MSRQHPIASGSAEGYSPPGDMADPFNQRYYDEPDRDPRGRERDTYASDSSFDQHDRYYNNDDPYHHADTDSERGADVYGQPGAPSAESLGPKGGYASGPPFADFGVQNQYEQGREPYPAWSADRQIPLSKEEIEDIFLDLQQKFGFQRDSMRNMVRIIQTFGQKQITDIFVTV